MSSALAQTDAISPRKRTSAEYQRRDNYTRTVRLAGVVSTSQEGKLLRAIRTDLMRHVGGSPSALQRILIERAAMLSLHIARMDVVVLKNEEMSDQASMRYLSWNNALTRTLCALGLEPPPSVSPKPDAFAVFTGGYSAA